MNTLLEEVPVVLPPVVKVIQDSSVGSDIFTAFISGVLTTLIATALAYVLSNAQAKKSEENAKIARRIEREEIQRQRAEDLKNEKQFITLKHEVFVADDSLKLISEINEDIVISFDEYSTLIESAAGGNRDIPNRSEMRMVEMRINKNFSLLNGDIDFLGVDMEKFNLLMDYKNEVLDYMTDIINKINDTNFKLNTNNFKHKEYEQVLHAKFGECLTAALDLQMLLKSNREKVLKKLKD